MILLAFGWIFWCGLHSFLISASVHTWVHNRGGLIRALYRLAYVVFSILSLLPLLWYQRTLPEKILFSWSGSWRWLQLMLLAYGLFMAVGGSRVYDGAFFLGFAQWQAYRQGRRLPCPGFSREGILRYVRHPWYSGGLALLWALGPITDVTLPVRLILSVYVVIGILLEEVKLKRELGPPYRAYCRRVPMLLPWKGRI